MSLKKIIIISGLCQMLAERNTNEFDFVKLSFINLTINDTKIPEKCNNSKFEPVAKSLKKTEISDDRCFLC